MRREMEDYVGCYPQVHCTYILARRGRLSKCSTCTCIRPNPRAMQANYGEPPHRFLPVQAPYGAQTDGSSRPRQISTRVK